MRDAERRVINAGIRGGNAHAEIDEATIIMATMSWAVREIKTSNEKLIREVCNGNGNGKGRLRRNVPAAGVGAAVMGGVMAVLAFLRDFFGS